MAKTYTELLKSAGALKSDADDLSNFSANVSKLPYDLKDEFRKRQDPKLDEAINKAKSRTFGAAIEGLEKYQDISNPFARRNLAEKYQGGIEQGYSNLVDEKTRREGVYADYVSKWSGLYGVEASRRQNNFNNKVTLWNQEKTLADSAYSRADKEKKSTLSNSELIKEISNLKTQGGTWQDINDYLVDQYGTDTTSGGFADNQLRKAFGEEPFKEEKEQTAKQQYETSIYEEKLALKEKGISNSRSEAKNGEMYYDGDGNIRKKSWGFAGNDEIVGEK